jgi:hypothetical protein
MTHDTMILSAVNEAIKQLGTVLNSNRRERTKIDAIAQYVDRREQIINHAARVGVTIPHMPEYSIDAQTIAEHKIRKAEQEAAAELIRLKAAKKQQWLDKKQLKEWLTTGAGRYPNSYRTHGADQLTICGEIVITNQGAEVPLAHATKALLFYDTITRPYHTNGHKISLGIFTLDSISENGTVKAGCHTFTAAEIARFRKQWNLGATQ